MGNLCYIKIDIHHKHSLYKKSLQDKTPESNQKYNKYKNKLTTVIHFAEKNYYAEKFEMAKGNIIKTWLTIKHIVKMDQICPIRTP